jgi:very-short-patch-repair endonuclease
MPGLFCADGAIRYALVPRAVADAVRPLPGLADVRAVVAEAVQRGMCPIPRLAEELAAGPVRGSAQLRQALAEVADGIRSPAEADLRDLIIGARLPMPMFNPRLLVGEAFLAAPDCWWPQAGVAVEVDSRAWHLSPREWEHTLARHARMSAHGINVLHFTPRQIKRERSAVAANIDGALATGRPLPHIRAVPAS